MRISCSFAGTYISFHIFLKRKTFVIICPSEVAYTPNVDNFGKKKTQYKQPIFFDLNKNQ